MVVETINGTELRFKNPGRLLLVVLAFIFWGVGFIDLLGHTSAEPDVFGLYSLPFFVFLLFYGSTIVLWILLFFNSNLLSRVADFVEYIQTNTRLALIAFAGIAIALIVIFEWNRWSRLPALQLSAFGLVTLSALILLFSNWNEKTGRQAWRRVITYPLIALVALEAIFQAMAWFGVLPGNLVIGGNFYPYERIYTSGETFRSGFANRYGWNSPDTILEDEKKRVLIVGGSYVQALQVPPELQIGSRLSNLVNQGQMETTGQTEFITIGMPGFGLSPFLYEDVMTELPNLMKYDEVVVLIHLGDDFQSPLPIHNSIAYTVSDTNEVEVDSDDARLRHDLTHYYLRGYMSLQLVETLRSNYLTPKVISQLVQGRERKALETGPSSGDRPFDFPRTVGFVTDTYALTEPGHAGIKNTDLDIIPGGNNFMFVQGGSADSREALVITESLLETAQEIAQSHGATLRVVTIPEFPEAFYNSYQGAHWNPQIGEYDLFLPERALIEIADKHHIPILPMGHYMLADGLTVEEVRALYLSSGAGSFTPEGHEYYSAAIHSCFYVDAPDSLC